MAKPVNLIRNANAKLIAKDVDFFGKRWAIQDRVDGYSLIDVTVKDTTESVKIYLEGDDSITTFAVPKNIDKLCAYALASFPSIENLYLFKQDGLVVLEDTLSYLQDLEHIYVPSAYLSSYISTYASMTVIHSGYDQFTTTSDYIGYYVYYGDTSVKVTADNKDDLNITAGTTIAYDKAPFSNIFEGDTYIIKHTEGEDELTIEEVELQHSMLDSTKVIIKVIVPVEFTSYESGSIAKIQELFTNMTHLVTTYEAGEMEIDFTDEDWVDILEKIEEKEKTLDEALVYARYLSITHVDNTALNNDDNLIIVPPMPANKRFAFVYTEGSGSFYNCPNLLYIDKIYATSDIARLIMPAYITKEIVFQQDHPIVLGIELYPEVKKAVLTFEKGTSEAYDTTLGERPINVFPELLKLNGLTSKKLRFYSINATPSRDCMLVLFNSLGTPTTTGIIEKTVYSQNPFANLQPQDIQIAYNKNWALSPTPSAFTFTIGGNTYSCDFGMTWTAWVASAYNTDGYIGLGTNVVDSTGKIIQLDNANVNSDDMIRYGDSFSISSQTLLPNEYQQVEYLESNGTQFIDIGFKPNQNTRIKIKTNIVSLIGTYDSVFGSRGGSEYFVFYASNEIDSRYGGVNEQFSLTAIGTHLIDFNKNIITIDRNKKTYSQSTFQLNYNCYLFAVNNSGAVQFPSNQQIYYTSVYDNGVLIRDLIPCYRKADSVAGLYDLVNGVFYTNAGTGTFLKGNNIV